LGRDAVAGIYSSRLAAAATRGRTESVRRCIFVRASLR
jgi:hypothetical protein